CACVSIGNSASIGNSEMVGRCCPTRWSMPFSTASVIITIRIASSAFVNTSARSRAMTDEHCACGLPLHYSAPELQAEVERMIALAGGNPLVIVTVTSKRPGVKARHFLVQRHYIALHGLKTQELLKGNIPGAKEMQVPA